MKVQRIVVHLLIAGFIVGACRSGAAPGGTGPSAEDVAATARSAAGTAASSAGTQAVEIRATVTVLAGEFRPTAEALLTQAADLVATGRAMLGTAGVSVTLGAAATATPTPPN